jgi:malate dehydrogenase (oxaloacetate-decarboxylating)
MVSEEHSAAMVNPSASYSLTVRCEIDNKPGMLGRLASLIGREGGDIGAIDIVRADRRVMVRDITINARDDAHGQAIVRSLRTLPGIRVVHVSDRTFLMHLGGKIEVQSRFPIKTRDDLSMVYTPGVARVCNAIAADPAKAWALTIKRNTVAIVSDGTAVLGLGNIGPAAAMPVMEGKAMLFKEFAGVDAFPLCLATTDPDAIVETVANLSPGFGGINLEDISSPRCFTVEERLKERLDIPVFHDDQHGTAVVVLAALMNALRIVGKDLSQIRVVINGLGAAGVACCRILLGAGVRDIICCDRQGILCRLDSDDLLPIHRWVASVTNEECLRGTVHDAMRGADVFLGVSAPHVIDRADVAAMGRDPIVFALANPIPEVQPEEVEDIVGVMATGRSDYPNQINNVLCFPGLFRGALDCQATTINEEMKLAAARAIAGIVDPYELSAEYIVPSVFNRRVAADVAVAVAAAGRATGVARRLKPVAGESAEDPTDDPALPTFG